MGKTKKLTKQEHYDHLGSFLTWAIEYLRQTRKRNPNPPTNGSKVV